MGFLNQLGKDFVRSAVRQVGRDSGRVISNQIYNGKHGTPVYNSQNREFISESELDKIDWEIQPYIKGGGIKVFLQGFFVQFIPFMTLYVLGKAIYYYTKTTQFIYQKGYVTQVDKRYRHGYKVIGTSIEKSNYKRDLTDEEIYYCKERSRMYFYSICVFILFNFLLIYINKNPI